MTEYIAVVFGLGIVMFYLLDFSKQFATEGNDLRDKYLNFVRLFYILASMTVGLGLVYTLLEIGNLTGVTSGTISFLTTNVWIWGTIIFLTLIFMGIYFLLVVPKAVKEAIKLKYKGEDEDD